MKGQKLFFLFFLCSPLFVLSRDTVLLDIIKVPFPILSLANDTEGNIYVHAKGVVYKYQNNQMKFIRNATPDDREMVVENGAVTFLNHHRPDIDRTFKRYLKDLNNNEIWRKFVASNDQSEYIFKAKDNFQHIWVTSGTNLHKLSILPYYDVLHRNKSIRGVDTLRGKLLVNTYSGIFLGDKRIWNKFTYSHGNYVKTSASQGIIIGNYISNVEGDSIRFDYSVVPQIRGVSYAKIARFNNIYWIASDNGLFRIIDKKVIRSHLKGVIHNLQVVDKRLMASTNKGIYYLEKDTWFPLSNFPRIPFNGFVKIDNLYYGLSLEGLYAARSFFGKSKRKWGMSIDCYELLQDNKNGLWLSTSNGIFRFSPFNENYEYLFKNVEFNKRSSFKMNSSLYFGSVKGLYVIHTDYFKEVKNDFRRELSLCLNGSLLFACSYIFFVLIKLLMRKKVFKINRA